MAGMWAISAARSGFRLGEQAPSTDRAATESPSRQARTGSGRARLAGIPLDPVVRRDGVLPKVLFRHCRSLRIKVLSHNPEHLWISSPLVAIGPVAAIDEAVLAEDIPNLIEPVAIEGK